MRKPSYVTANCVRCDRLSQIATRGQCFTCYRKDREAANPGLKHKRLAYSSTRAREAYEAKKLTRYHDLIESLEQQISSGLADHLELEEPAGIAEVVEQIAENVLRIWMISHERRSKLILMMAEIEAAGKTPIIVAKEDLDDEDW